MAKPKYNGHQQWAQRFGKEKKSIELPQNLSEYTNSSKLYKNFLHYVNQYIQKLKI